MARHEAIKKALNGKKDSKNKLHTHAVKYERADNGGIHAHVERHTSSGHHHTEHHVIANADDAAAHLQEHMGDQPAMGQGTPPDSVAPPPAMGAGPDGGADAGAGAPSPAAGM